MGIIVVVLCVINIALISFNLYFLWHGEYTLAKNDAHADERASRALLYALAMTSLIDAVFDLTQGFVAVCGRDYTSVTRTVHLCVSWVGAADTWIMSTKCINYKMSNKWIQLQDVTKPAKWNC